MRDVRTEDDGADERMRGGLGERTEQKKAEERRSARCGWMLHGKHEKGRPEGMREASRRSGGGGDRPRWKEA